MAAPHSYKHFKITNTFKGVGNPDAAENAITYFPNKEKNPDTNLSPNPALNLRSLWDIYSSSRELDIVPHCLNETIYHSHYNRYILVVKNKKK